MSTVGPIAVFAATGIVRRRPTAAGGAFRATLSHDHADRVS